MYQKVKRTIDNNIQMEMYSNLTPYKNNLKLTKKIESTTLKCSNRLFHQWKMSKTNLLIWVKLLSYCLNL